MILANDQKIDYIRHIIRAESEVRFLRQLEVYAQSSGNARKVDDFKRLFLEPSGQP